MITMLRRRVALQHLGRYLEGQGHSMTFLQNSFRPIILWFEVEFYNYFTGMITILRQRVTCNIWVAILKAKFKAWPCSKIVSGPKLCYLKSNFTTTFDKLLLCTYFQYLFRGITRFWPALVQHCCCLSTQSVIQLQVRFKARFKVTFVVYIRATAKPRLRSRVGMKAPSPLTSLPSMNVDMWSVECYNCHDLGHFTGSRGL